MWTLCLVVFILDSIACASWSHVPCDVDSCLDRFSLTGDKKQLCVYVVFSYCLCLLQFISVLSLHGTSHIINVRGTRSALECLREIQLSQKCNEQERGQGSDLYSRLEGMSGCLC